MHLQTHVDFSLVFLYNELLVKVSFKLITSNNFQCDFLIFNLGDILPIFFVLVFVLIKAVLIRHFKYIAIKMFEL